MKNVPKKYNEDSEDFDDHLREIYCEKVNEIHVELIKKKKKTLVLVSKWKQILLDGDIKL